MPETLQELIADARREAERAPFSVDNEIYERSGRDPKSPILFAGTLDSPLCIVGRDLGKSEVSAGQPLVGAAGRSVRAGIIETYHRTGSVNDEDSLDDPLLQRALEHALFTNTVPFKPVGNKAYPADVRQRFRPFLERLLVVHWKGTLVITLGTQAFEWFARYGDADEFHASASTDARFESVFKCNLPRGHDIDGPREKTVLVHPLPHPSPLNRRWFSRFPTMLARRLQEVRG